ncbi:YhdH/YhfP family quinone oxidoreductase [Spirochaeta lutea]|uniref:Enoyl reductase (ER) domain-containing protein n=1 Tax=Spirochaeta lutea TaxID=1480694 RepID=A0A098QUA0_9SPIO|nr:YhdH/YhfP family quinone oxidoreductase [Spirochaeta lutea]KGE71410.1 hypothetical protein DC28_11490 [Spirochaeta lutea]
MQYRAYEVSQKSDGSFTGEIVTKDTTDLPAGEVLIRVHASSLNFKDMLSSRGNRGVTRQYPHVPGIDAAGEVVEGSGAGFGPGDEVIVCGFDLGMNTPGGFGQYIRVPAGWVLPMPGGLDARTAMALGTAGLTAGLCIHALQHSFVFPDSGPVLVTGASGGVGSIAVQILSKLGYSAWALTHHESRADWLRSLGAEGVLFWDEFDASGNKPLLPQEWAGAVDTLGDSALTRVLRSLKFGGAATSCGNVLSGDLQMTVYPFILRGITLRGIASADTPLEQKRSIWEHLATQWSLPQLLDQCTQIPLEEVGSCLNALEASSHRGRFVVNLS